MKRFVRQAVTLLLTLAAAMQALLPLAAAGGQRNTGAAVQVLCTTHGTMWIVVDDGAENPADKGTYVQGAACPLCAGAVHTGLAPGPDAPPRHPRAALAHERPEAALTLSTSRPWRLHFSSRAPPLS